MTIWLDDELGELTPQEQEMIEILEDPVIFARFHFNWIARDYQEHILRAPLSHTRIVSRCGRRIGKTECMAIHMIWYAYTNENAVCLLTAPYENQIKLVFKRIRELIAMSPEIQSSIQIDRRHPEEITFLNGSSIRGFTAGTKSGAGGASVRGQRADWIYFDEMDYLNDDDIEAIYAIALERPDIGVWGSSTPTGRRGKFWEWCTNPDQKENWPWHEIHYPTTVLPAWGPEMESEMRSMFSGEAYKHEVLAEFGEETIGVFLKEHIDRATSNYKYVKYPQYTDPDIIRTIGVDWDKYENPTQIVVLEWNPYIDNTSETRKGMFRVVWREEIAPTERTLDIAVNKIIELNGIYHPSYIYVDRGFGEYQVEMLHKRGEQAGHDVTDPAYNLHKRVKGIIFSSKIEVRNPWTKEVDKKDVKPWMVNQTQLFLERDLLLISEHDRVIRKQFSDYQMVRKSASGRPVFTSVNDHALDATMLAILAMSMEHPEIAKTLEKMEVARRLAKVGPLPQLQARDQQMFKRDSEPVEVVSKSPYRGGPTWGKRGSQSYRSSRRRPLRSKF